MRYEHKQKEKHGVFGALGEGRTYNGKLLKAKRFFPAWLTDRRHELAKNPVVSYFRIVNWK
jgi:hypothetical protein